MYCLISLVHSKYYITIELFNSLRALQSTHISPHQFTSTTNSSSADNLRKLRLLTVYTQEKTQISILSEYVVGEGGQV